MYFHTHRCLLDYRTQILVIAGTLLTFITYSNSLDILNVTKGTYTTINCTYGEGEVRNLFWHPGNCSEEPPMPWIVRYLNGKVNSSDETRFWLGDDNSTLILKNVSIEDEGTYCCSVNIKEGIVDPHIFLTRVNVFGLDSKTLPVIPQCQEDDHDDLNSTTCTLIAPTSLTCELHGIYPNRSVTLEWHGYEGAISSITKSYSNDDRTYTFLATTQVLQAGNFSCNASFPSEEGQVKTGVPVTVTMVKDPANQIKYVAIIVPFIVIGLIVAVYCCVKRCRRRQDQSTDSYDRVSNSDAQGTRQGPVGQTEEDPKEIRLKQINTDAESVTPDESDGLIPDAQRRGNESTEQTEEDPQSSLPVQMDNGEGSSTSNESDGLVPGAQRRGNEPTEQSEEDPQSSLPVQMDNGEGCSTSNETHQEIRHNPDEIRDEVPDEKLNTLANQIPNEKYTDLANKLGISFNQADNILSKHAQDSMKAVRECLSIWKDRTGGSKAELKEILCHAQIGGLVKHIE